MKLTRSFSFRLLPKPPYSFELTVRKPAGWNLFTPFEIYEGGILWTALHLGDSLIGLKLWSEGTTDSPMVVATAFLRKAPSRVQKQFIRKSLAEMLGVGDDVADFYVMAKKDAILKHTIEDLYGLHDTHSSGVFGAAILAICLQMAPIKRSNAMMASIIDRHGEMAEFDGVKVRVWPRPRTISELRPAGFARECGLGYRAKFLVKLARALLDGFPTMEELARLPPEAAKEKLLELPGIGDYSADIISPRSGFPIDAWSVDVFSELFYGREPKNAREAIEEVKAEGIRRWGRWSWMAFFYVAQDLENLSKRLGIQLRLH